MKNIFLSNKKVINFIVDILQKMKNLLSIVAVLLLALNANGQWYTTTNTTGTVLYGSTNVTVVGAGTASTYASWCGAGPYWIGAGTPLWPGPASPGSYTYSFSPAVNAIKVSATAMNHGETIEITLNGVPYIISPGEWVPWAGSCGGGLYETLTGGVVECTFDTSWGSGTIVEIHSCGIVSCKVGTTGYGNGTVYTFEFSDSICFRATNNGPVCVNDTLKLFGLGDSVGASYSWIGPGGFSSAMHNPVIHPAVMTDTGTYRVIRHIGAVFDTAYTHVTLKPLPVIVATSNSPMCQGVSNTLTLFANPDSLGETFVWTGPNTFSSTLVNPTISGFIAADTGIYKVVATWNGCKDSGFTHVILAPVPPPPVISGITAYCTGDVFVPFAVTGSGTILWYNTATGGVGSAVPPVVSTAAGGSYTFYATQTILGCESNRDSIKVVVHVTPAPPVITGTTVYCQYFTYIPPTAAGTNILWYNTAAGGVGTLTPPVINTSIAGTYTIYASQSDSGCTSPLAPFTVIVNPKPVPPVIVDVPGNYCPGQAFVPYTIVTGTGVLWYLTPTGGVGVVPSPFINTSVVGPHTVWATQTLLGCESDRAAITVTVYDSVIAGFTFAIKYGCKADTVEFTNTSYQTSVYRWSFGDGNSSILKDPVNIYKWQGIDTVKLYSSSASCIDSSIQIINLVHPIRAQFAPDTDLICQGGTIAFTDFSVGTTLSYLWNFADGNTSASASPAHYYPRTGVYHVMEIVTDFVPCHDTAYRTIFVDSLSPIYMAITDTVICTGTHITFTGDYTGIGNTGIWWDMGNGDSVKDMNPVSYGYEQTGVFTVLATAKYRVCAEPGVSRTVRVLPPPVISLGPDTTICKGSQAITITDHLNKNMAGTAWLWNTGATSSSITVTEPGTYSATVRMNGCETIGSVKVTNDCYMSIPNVFTPNGDGMNDYFFPRQFLTSGLSSFSLQIFNRWGTLIFETNSLSGSGWDGKFNNVDQPSGAYVYIIDGTFKDGQKEHHQGNVTLLR